MTDEGNAQVRLALDLTRVLAGHTVVDDTLGEVLDRMVADVRAATGAALAEVWLRLAPGPWYRRGSAHAADDRVVRVAASRSEATVESPGSRQAAVVEGPAGTEVRVDVGQVQRHEVMLVLAGGVVDAGAEVVRAVLHDLVPVLHTTAQRVVAGLDLRRLARGTEDLSFVADVAGPNMQVSRSLADLLGIPDTWLSRTGIVDHVHPEDRALVGAVRRDLREGRHGPHDLEVRLQTAAGSYEWVAWRVWAVAAETRLYGVGRRIWREIREREFEHARRAVLEGIIGGRDLDDTLRDLATGLEARLSGSAVAVERLQHGSGRPRTVVAPSLPADAVELLAARPHGAVPRLAPDASPLLVTDLEADRAGGQQAPLRARLLDLGLRGRWSVALVDPSGARLGSLAVHRPDAVAPAPDEAEVVLGQAALATLAIGHLAAREQQREDDERFRLLAETATEAIWDWDLTTDRVWWSEGIEALYGKGPDELEPDSRSWTAYIHPDDRDGVLASLQEALDGGRAAWTGEYRLVHADGSPRWVLDRGTVIRDRTGRAVRMVGGMIDVTHRYQVEEQQLRLERMESIGVLTGGVAHDLNNVLAPIMVAAGMLLTEDLEEHLVEAAEIIQESAQRGADMIRQILTFVRGAGEQQQLLRIDDVLGAVQRLLRDALAPAVGLEVTLPPDPLHVVGDMTQVQQLLMNLAVNARDAMPEGGVVDITVDEVDVDDAWAVSVSEATPGRYVRIRVVDSGVGMAPEVVEQVFEPFFTTKPLGQGTGLGLSTAQAIVRGHDGFITVRSAPGRGTTFAVHLPAADRARDVATPRVDGTAVAGSGRTVLVIDDEAAVRTILRQTLRQHGFEVLVAADGAEGVATFAQHRGEVAVVVTDVLMPVMDGVATIRAIRRIEPEVPVIVISGMIDHDRLASLGDLGVQYFLPKPFTAEILLDVVGHVTGARTSTARSSARSGDGDGG